MRSLAHALGAEDGVDHAVSRSVADAGGKKQDHEREKEAQERPRGGKEEHSPDSQGHDDERPERHAGAADLIREPPPDRPGHRPDDGPQSGEPGGRVLRKSGGYENREASRVTYKGTKGYNTEVAHEPSVFAPGNGVCSRSEACETFRLFIKPYAQIAESRMRGTQKKAAFCANTSGAALRLLNGRRQPVPVGLKA